MSFEEKVQIKLYPFSFKGGGSEKVDYKARLPFYSKSGGL